MRAKTLIPLALIVRELGVSRRTIFSQTRSGAVKIAGRDLGGRLLITAEEAERMRSAHRDGKLIKTYLRGIGWPDEATYKRAWYARRKAERARQAQAAQQGA